MDKCKYCASCQWQPMSWAAILVCVLCFSRHIRNSGLWGASNPTLSHWKICSDQSHIASFGFDWVGVGVMENQIRICQFASTQVENKELITTVGTVGKLTGGLGLSFCTESDPESYSLNVCFTPRYTPGPLIPHQCSGASGFRGTSGIDWTNPGFMMRFDSSTNSIKAVFRFALLMWRFKQ